jgi:hypothetical protein
VRFAFAFVHVWNWRPVAGYLVAYIPLAKNQHAIRVRVNDLSYDRTVRLVSSHAFNGRPEVVPDNLPTLHDKFHSFELGDVGCGIADKIRILSLLDRLDAVTPTDVLSAYRGGRADRLQGTHAVFNHRDMQTPRCDRQLRTHADELLRLAFVEGAQSNGRLMRDSASRVFVWSAGLLGLLILAMGPALDGAGLAEAATVPALMAVWAAAVVLIDRWVVKQRD